MARSLNQSAGEPDILWQHDKRSETCADRPTNRVWAVTRLSSSQDASFSAEFDRRISRTRDATEAQDGLILFRQESMFYLTGYDARSRPISANDGLALASTVSRDVDRRISGSGSIGRVRPWCGMTKNSPTVGAMRILTGQRALMINEALDGLCEIVDASDLVRLVRLVKSELELDMSVNLAGSAIPYRAHPTGQLRQIGLWSDDEYTV